MAFHEAAAAARRPVARTVPANAGDVLLPLARNAIAAAAGRAEPPPEDAAAATWLQAPGATFVTLTRDGQLRGCIGSLQAHRSIQADVQANAVAAAMRDPRFAPVTAGELDRIAVEVSLLSAAERLQFSGEAEALAQLRPGIDGLIFECGAARSTFLPQVWSQLPDPADFLAQLKRKAGLPGDFWSDEVRLSRYTVHKWTEAQRRSAEQR
ncbi:MAG: AmmeMemoRadiSam system protein A [Burkholderiaceae bacterium]|nr:AmmeMemoRadiSam system protein A [Burkholderiaceae bacterium]MBP8102328.1 AmmeMemoRadiSam system protein A [Burkholderiaceae bacterium]